MRKEKNLTCAHPYYLYCVEVLGTMLLCIAWIFVSSSMIFNQVKKKALLVLCLIVCVL